MDIVNDIEPSYDVPHPVAPIASHESEENAIISEGEDGHVVDLPDNLHANDLKKEKIEAGKYKVCLEYLRRNRHRKCCSRSLVRLCFRKDYRYRQYRRHREDQNIFQ